MSYGNYQSVPFWDFIRSLDNSGAGVDRPAQTQGFSFFGPQGPQGPHPSGFPFGGPFGGLGMFGPGAFGPGPHGRGRGRNCRRRDGSHERPHGSHSPSPHGDRTDREGSPHRHGWGPRGSGRHGRGGPGRHWGPSPFGGPREGMPFDMSALMNAFSSHPFAQALRTYAEQAGFGAEAQRSGETLVNPENDNENSFMPPIDVFSTEKEYVLHIALPGAKKEDVGVNWDAEKGVLNVAGVVYRQGDEEFLKTLSTGERKVGMFERSVKLPQKEGGEEKEEVDGEGITAKLEDGVLVVAVPKVEKEWTEVKKVDIE